MQQSTGLVSGRLAYRVPLDVAAILVSVPCWGRDNLFDEPPTCRPYQPELALIFALRDTEGPAIDALPVEKDLVCIDLAEMLRVTPERARELEVEGKVPHLRHSDYPYPTTVHPKHAVAAWTPAERAEMTGIAVRAARAAGARQVEAYREVRARRFKALWQQVPA